MVEVLRHQPGKLIGLLALDREHWEAIEADLLRSGWTLDDVPHRLTWRAVLAHVRTARRGTALYSLTNGERADWGLAEQLAAEAVDALRISNWQRTENGRKGRKQPKPVKRPWDVADKAEQKQFGSGAVSIDEFRRFWDNAAVRSES